MIDTTRNLFCVTRDRISRMKECLSELLSSKDAVSVRLFAKFAGCIASMWLALGPVSCLQSRSIHALIQASVQHSTWNARTVLSDSALAELHFLG